MNKDGPLCKCGCGNAAAWNKWQGRWNVYIHTHHVVGNYKIGKQWGLIGDSGRGAGDILKRELQEKAKDPPCCECGCGIRVAWNDKRVRSQGLFKRWNRYVVGHNPRGISRTDEVRERISKGLSGRVLSEESRARGSEAKMGEKNPMYGRGNERTGSNNPMYGRKISEEHKRRITETQSGDKHHNWQGGISRLPYTQDWTRTLKEATRQRDGHQCKMCGIGQDEISEKLNVHHIDYEKENCNTDNLISLCRSCHAKTSSGSRAAWIAYFNGQPLLAVASAR